MWIGVNVFLYFEGFIIGFEHDGQLYIPGFFRSGAIVVILVFNVFSSKKFRYIFSGTEFTLKVHQGHKIIVLIFDEHWRNMVFLGNTRIISTEGRRNVDDTCTILSSYKIANNYAERILGIFCRLKPWNQLFVMRAC